MCREVLCNSAKQVIIMFSLRNSVHEPTCNGNVEIFVETIETMRSSFIFPSKIMSRLWPQITPRC